jgi:hypothetical protein
LKDLESKKWTPEIVVTDKHCRRIKTL